MSKTGIEILMLMIREEFEINIAHKVRLKWAVSLAINQKVSLPKAYG